MKTLDEVIRGFECCEEINCAECPYANWDNTDVVHCNDTKKEDDALHYLKTYKDDKDDLTALRAFWAEQQDNSPLTWDELKQMEGKPVWVEYNLHLSAEAQKLSKAWFVISGFQPLGKHEMMVATNHFVFTDYEQFSGWQAYRKERG